MQLYKWKGNEYVPEHSDNTKDEFANGWRMRFWSCDEQQCELWSWLSQLAPAPLWFSEEGAAAEVFIADIELQHIERWTSELATAPFNYAVTTAKTRSVKPQLLVFDMDSTLIQMECIDELARRCGFYDKVAAITESAMRGELDFAQSLRKRVALLDGLSTSVIDELAADLPFTEGVKAMAEWAKQQGMTLAVVSGGFVPFVEALKHQLNFDFAFANTLEHKDGLLTGKVSGSIVDGERKKALLIELRERLALPKEAVWAIGDGANDLPMMQEAGLGIAFDAKPTVKAQASAAIHQPDMTSLLGLLQHW